MKKALSTLLFASLVINCFSQFKTPAISFKDTTHDFSTINEVDGKVSHTFTFESTGDVPLLIYDIKSSCFCSVSHFDKDPIQKGKEGKIIVTYDPDGNNGHFRKSLKVYTNTQSEPYILYIKGNVNPLPKTISEQHSIVLGKLRIERLELNFKTITSGKVYRQTISVINTADSDISISFPELPSYISLQDSTQILAPNQKRDLTFYCRPANAEKTGSVNDVIPIIIDGKTNDRYQIKVMADIIEESSTKE